MVNTGPTAVAESRARLIRFAVFAIGFGVIVLYLGSLWANHGDWRGVFGDGSLYLAAYGLSIAVFGQLIWKALGYTSPALSQQLMREVGVLIVGAFFITVATGFAYAESKPYIEIKQDAQLALGMDDQHSMPNPNLPATQALHQLEAAAQSNSIDAEVKAARALTVAVADDATKRTWPARQEHAIWGGIALLAAATVAGRAEYKVS
jgi:hypothetical protein